MEGLALVAGVAFVGGAVVQKLTGMMGADEEDENSGDGGKKRLQNNKGEAKSRNLKALNLTKHEVEVSSAIIESDDIPVDFNSIGGLTKQVEEIYDMVIAPLAYPELYSQSASAQRPTGLLLYGPPGTGKTSLAKAIAKTSGASFLAITAAMITSRWAGETPKLVEAVFTLARKMSPCVIFIDEVDGLLSTRSDSDGAHMSALKTTFMQQWDGMYSTQSQSSDSQDNILDGWILVIGATNRPQSIDDAVMRRFPRKVFVGMPDHEARVDILRVLLKGEKCAPDLDLDLIASECENYSGSDLKELVRLAATRCIRDAILEARRREKSSQEQGDLSPRSRKKITEAIQPRDITTNDLIDALDDLTPSGPKAQENWKLVGPEWDGSRKSEGHARDRIAARRRARIHSTDSLSTTASGSTFLSSSHLDAQTKAEGSIQSSVHADPTVPDDATPVMTPIRDFTSNESSTPTVPTHPSNTGSAHRPYPVSFQRKGNPQGSLINAALTYASFPRGTVARSQSVRPMMVLNHNDSPTAHQSSSASSASTDMLKKERSINPPRSPFYFLPDTPKDDELSNAHDNQGSGHEQSQQQEVYSTPTRSQRDPSVPSTGGNYPDSLFRSSVVSRAINLSPYSAITSAVTKQQMRERMYNETFSPEEGRGKRSSLRDNSNLLTSTIEEASQSAVNAILSGEGKI